MAAGNGPGNAALEELIQQRLRAAAVTGPVIGKADRGQPLPLSAGQQQMWVLHQFDPASPAYLMTWVQRLSGRLDHEALRWAWEKVVERHEILRTRYTGGTEQPVQIIDPPGRFELRFIDLTAEPSARRERRAQQIAEWERKRPFDLAAQHPVRVTLLVAGPELHLMVVSIHHIACDGESYSRIATELGLFYEEHTRCRPAALPDVTVQYADFAAWELAGKANGAMRPHLDYWRGALTGETDRPLPLDRPHPVRPDSRGGAVDIAIEPTTAEGIRCLATAHRASPYMLMLAVYHATLAHISQSSVVSVGVPVSARSVPALDELVGYLVNTVVVRSNHLDVEEQTFVDLLTQVRQRFLEAMDHRAAPFKWVVDEVNPARAGTANPLFQAGFDMEQADEGGLRLTGLKTDLLELAGPPSAKFDLTLHVAVSSDERLFARIEYAAAVIDEETAQAWAGYFEQLLGAVLRTPHEPLSQIHQRLRALSPTPGRVAPGRDPQAAAATDAADSDANRLLVRIHRAWCDVLDVDSVDFDANFFDVNGDSLRAIALAGQLKDEGVDVSAADIFAHQTIAELAEMCAGQLTNPARPASVAPFELVSQDDRDVIPPDVVDAYPLAAMQLGMLLELRARPDVNTYQDTSSFLIRDDGPFDADALQRAVQLVVDRHEVLRTTFDLNSYSVPLQLVHREAKITVGLAHYGTLGPDGWLPKLKDYAARERRSPMDLACAPLIRVFAHTSDDSAQWWITITECHPILEGWSFHTMLMEFLTVYREIRAGRTPTEPEPISFRYADYVAAEAQARQSEGDREYWRGVLEGRTDATLPTAWQDGRDTPRERYQHLVAIWDLETDLRRLATETRTSMKAVLLAAHLKVMSMVFGSLDFFTGLVCDARPEIVGAERVLGMYLNTVPFAMPSGARTWGELVTAVYDGLTAMWPHRVFPMQVIQQEFGGGRLLDVFFNYLDFHQVDGDLVDEDRTLNDNDNEFALHVFTLPGILKFNTTNHNVSRDAIARLAAVYRTVLEEMSYGPDGDAGSACLPPRERARVSSSGSVREPARGPATVLEAFALTVHDHRDDPAVRCGAQSLTYGRLASLADTVAQRLRGFGVGPGSLVAVAPQRDIATPAALIAVWMTGAAWILIEPSTLAAHRREAGRYANVSAVVAATTEGIADTDLAGLPVVVARGETKQPAASKLAPVPGAHPRPEDVACVVSTGQAADAAGMVFSHRALVRALQSTHERLETFGVASKPGSSWLCAASLISCGALTELLTPLISGGVVVVTTSELPDATTEMKDLVDAGAVTHMRSTPLVAERVLANGLADEVAVIVVGEHGGAPPPARDCGRLIPAVEIDGLPGWLAFDGRPLRDLGMSVVDGGLRPVATGVVGELCLSGARLADGFHADPAATAERFSPDPLGDSGSRLYRTGHLARFANEGALEHLGPIDQHAYLNGHRIELYRTRELLTMHPEVMDSCVLLRPDPPRGKQRLVGYVRTATGTSLDAEMVRKSLAEIRVPRRLIPDIVVPMESWPLAGSGTIDLERLPEPRAGSPTGPAVGEKPWDDQFEVLLRAALVTVSHTGELTPSMALSEFGLDSFSTVGLLVALEQAYDIAIPDEFQVVDMFRTAGALWETVAALRAAEPTASDPMAHQPRSDNVP